MAFEGNIKLPIKNYNIKKEDLEENNLIELKPAIKQSSRDNKTLLTIGAIPNSKSNTDLKPPSVIMTTSNLVLNYEVEVNSSGISPKQKTKAARQRSKIKIINPENPDEDRKNFFLYTYLL